MLNQGGGNIMLSKTTNPRWTAPEVIRDSQIGPAGGVNREVWGFIDHPSRRLERMCAPVVHTGSAFTIAPHCLHPADVYSFGIIMWEMLTWQQPYEEMMSVQVKGGDCLGDPWGTCR